MTTQIATLAAVVDQLPAFRQGFARDLIAKAPRGLSLKQAYWVGELIRLANEAAAPAPEAAPAATVSIAPIIALLDKAAAKLKHPAILVRAGDRDLRLSIAGPTSKAPGTVNVCSPGSFYDRSWYGRIERDGAFEPSRKFDAGTISAVTLALQAMAADPAKAAADYGHLTGVCCFCNTPLTDGRSTEVGYGPTCAKHYGLPWGKTTKSAPVADLLALAA